MSDGRIDQVKASTAKTYSGLGYEPTRFARKHGITRQQARDLIKQIGNDRDALNQAAAELKRKLGDTEN